MNSTKRIVTIVSSLLLLCCLASPASGYAGTQDETTDYMKVPMSQWQMLNQEWNEQHNELMKVNTALKQLKKPSEQLQKELSEAKELLQKSQTELMLVKKDLTLASSEVEKLKTSLLTLKQGIEKERRVHRRQVWQNRIWCVVAGVGIGMAVKK